MRGMSGAAPVLLLSMPQMTDPNFTRTVILLCDYTEEGAFGLVVNRQMSEPAWTMIKTEPPVRVDPDLRLWMGGPVDPQQTWVLMSDSHGPDEEQREICPGCRVQYTVAWPQRRNRDELFGIAPVPVVTDVSLGTRVEDGGDFLWGHPAASCHSRPFNACARPWHPPGGRRCLLRLP